VEGLRGELRSALKTAAELRDQLSAEQAERARLQGELDAAPRAGGVGGGGGGGAKGLYYGRSLSGGRVNSGAMVAGGGAVTLATAGLVGFLRSTAI
jgi:hypothetical protein